MHTVLLDWMLSAKPGSPVPAEVILPLRTAFLEYIKTGEPLDRTLGFRGSRIRYCWLKAQRDTYLRNAAAKLDASSASNRAALLASEINRFMSVSWPRYRHLVSPPERLSQLHSELFFAAKIGLKMPGYRQLLRLL